MFKIQVESRTGNIHLDEQGTYFLPSFGFLPPNTFIAEPEPKRRKTAHAPRADQMNAEPDIQPLGNDDFQPMGAGDYDFGFMRKPFF